MIANDIVNFTNFEKEVKVKYTNYFHEKIKEKQLNPSYLDPHTMIFMNDGYAEIDNNGYPFDSTQTQNCILNPKYTNFKYQLNLYKQLLDFAEIKTDKQIDVVMDIGCGKGGGISFYKDFYNFDTCIGIDLTPINIEIANSHAKDVKFHVASATNLPISDNSVDVITCVESMMYYDPFVYFIQEVYRVLKNHGKILISMPMNPQYEKDIENSFLSNGFDLIKKENITKNVRMACAISKNRFRDISAQEAEMMNMDEQRYFNKNINYKNMMFVKKG